MCLCKSSVRSVGVGVCVHVSFLVCVDKLIDFFFLLVWAYWEIRLTKLSVIALKAFNIIT